MAAQVVKDGIERWAPLTLGEAEQEIESRPLWKPMHLQPVFKDARFVGSGVSEALVEWGLCLPSGSALEEGERARVIELILNAHSAAL